MGKGVVSVFQRRISGARWAAGGQTKSSVQQAEPPVADAKGDQRGMGQHSGVWSSAVSAVVWNLPQLYLENGVHPPLLGLFDKCLGTPDAKWGMYPGAYGWYTIALLNTPVGKCGISPGAYLWVVPLCRPVCSGLMCRYLRCVSLPDVSVLTM